MDSGLKWLKSYTLWTGVLLGLIALATMGAKFVAPHFTQAPHNYWVDALNEFQNAYSQGLPWPIWNATAHSGRGEPLLWGLAPLPYWFASLALLLGQLPSLSSGHWAISYALSEGGLSAAILLTASIVNFVIGRKLSPWKRGVLTLLPWFSVAWAVTGALTTAPLITLALGIAGATSAASYLLAQRHNGVGLCIALSTSLLSFGLTILPALGLLMGLGVLARVAGHRTWSEFNIFNRLKTLILFIGVTSFYWGPLYAERAISGVRFLSLNEQLGALTVSSSMGLKLMLPAFALCAAICIAELLRNYKFAAKFTSFTTTQTLPSPSPRLSYASLLICTLNIIFILSTAHTAARSTLASNEEAPVLSAALKLEPARPPLELVKGVTDVNCRWVSQVQVICDAFAIRASTLRTRIMAFPGWSARLDQSKATLKFPTDLSLTPGRHTVHMQYKWQWHHLLSFFTSILFALLLMIQFVKQWGTTR